MMKKKYFLKYSFKTVVKALIVLVAYNSLKYIILIKIIQKLTFDG